MSTVRRARRLSAAQMLRIDEICDRFENDLKTGGPRDIESYLAGTDDALNRLLLRELIAVEFGHRINAGEHPDLEEYVRRYSLEEDDACVLRELQDPGRSPPSRIGPYELIEQLGAGSFGSVWRAYDSRLSREVALKLAERASIREPEQFLREVRATGRLRHPNIISVLDVGQRGSWLYIVRDYVPGRSLGEVLKEQTFEPRRAAELCLQVAETLAYTHEADCIHRDLKPGNIIIDNAGTPYLTDFGLAKLEAADVLATQAGAVMGTPAYMSPEQARGESHLADARTDVYSLGATLYQMLCGEPPFRGTYEMIVVQILHDEPPSPVRLNRAIPADLATICLKCLRKSPHDRYAAARNLADDLQRFLDGRTIVARPIGPVRRLWRWSLRNKAIAGLSGSIVLLLLAIVAVTSVMTARVTEAWKQERSQRVAAQEMRQVAASESERALAEVAVSARVTEFLESVFSTSDPVGENLRGVTTFAGEKVTARQLLDRASRRIDRELAGQPRVQARLMDVIANVYRSLGLFREAERMFAAADKTRDGVVAAEPAVDLRQETATGLSYRGQLHQARGEYAAAERSYQAAIDLRRELFGPDSLEVADVEFQRGMLQLDVKQPAAAKSAFERVLSIRKGLLGARHRQIKVTELALLQCAPTASSFTDLPIQYLTEFGDEKAGEGLAIGWKILAAKNRKDYGTALTAYRKLLDLLKQELGEQHPLSILALGDYADLAFAAGDYNIARTSAAQAIARGRELAPRHPQLRDALRRFGMEIQEAGHYREAERCLREALAIGFDHPVHRHDATLALIANLSQQGATRAALDFSEPLSAALGELSPAFRAWLSHLHSELLQSAGHIAEAARWQKQALETARSVSVGSVDPIWMGRLSRILLHAGDLSVADDFAKAALERAEVVYPPGHPRIADQLVLRAEVLFRLGQSDEARQLAGRALNIRETTLPPDDVRREEARSLMARLSDHK